ncbi:gamma-glutamyltransferase family protein [Celeribacter sp.]|uniref:gamma-glutamyltransferase family protein n=1 Tax=Celeribacter sp. TaxID=1890673 RepID=UPI003A95B765
MMQAMLPQRSRMSVFGAVASANPLATQAGLSVLQNGGNAFDAAIATAATLTVAEPFMSGLAGMGNAVMWDARRGEVRVLDFVPRLPMSYDPDQYSERTDAARGAMSVGLPGTLMGWAMLNDELGTRPLRDLFAPAITLAERGVALTEFAAAEIRHARHEVSGWSAIGSGFAQVFGHAGEPRVGDVLRLPELAQTLRRIGEEGPDHLYHGPLGDQIAATVQGLGGTLTATDIAEVETCWRKPLSADYLGLSVNVPPPPCEGFQFLLTLKMLERVGLSDHPYGSAGHFDPVLRAIRLAAGQRIDANRPNADGLVRMFHSRAIDELSAQLAAGAGLTGATEHWDATSFADPSPAHTTSFSVADREGNLVCITQSLGSAFGSGVIVPGTGVTLNNFLFWADAAPGSPNRAAPGASLPMCMSPSIALRDGRPVLALGTPGGYGILQTQPQVYANLFDFGFPLQTAISLPRVRAWDGRAVQVETRGQDAVISGLRAKGHDATPFGDAWSMAVGGMQAIQINPDTGVMTAAADPRRDGMAGVL